jgi:hypothetical protein
MKKGDLAFFYHSSCKVPAIVGVMEIVQEHTPDRMSLPVSAFHKRQLTLLIQYPHMIQKHLTTTPPPNPKTQNGP